MSGLSKAGRKVSQVFFPSVCLHCHQQIEQQNLWLCGECYDGLQFVPEQHCPRCGYPTEKSECSNCAENDFKFTRALAVFMYDRAAKSLVHGLKYAGFTAISNWFALQMYKTLLGEDFTQSIDLVTAVPLHPVRKRERGFNQSELIAKVLAEKLGKPYSGVVLKRWENSESQTRLSGSLRRKNMQGVFRIGKMTPAGKKILLVDDVFTTGSTVNEASKVLLDNGAEQVYVLTACHGV